MSGIRYRPEIDGLRAVAIIPVVLYHAHVKFLSGGFIGVDVFFVISGFLITSLLMRDLEAGTFSLWDFWKRRALRILPALLAVTIFTLAAGAFLYFPEDYKSVGRQAAFQSIFASNIYFYQLSGYFNPDSATKPLLHTWSLAVEEQFYILFPALLYLLRARVRAYLKTIVICLALLSFAACVGMSYRFADAAFYLLPFRAWELLAGSLLALMPGTRLSRPVSEILGWTGLALIAYGMTSFTSGTLFPGWAALLPVAGAVLFIASNANAQNSAGKLLSLRLPVFIGLISYSLYLWHWPLMTMADYIPLIPPGLTTSAALVAASFGLAFLSWKFIETPFRRAGKYKSRKYVLACAIAALGFFGVTGSAAFLYAKFQPAPKGYLDVAKASKDFSPHRETCKRDNGARIDRDDVCQTNPGETPPSFVMWGDSHGDAETPLFYDLSKKYGRNGYVLFKHGCPAIVGYALRGDKGAQDCRSFNRAAFDFIVRHKIKTVFLTSYWESWLRENPNVYFEPELKGPIVSGLERTLDDLEKQGVKIHVLLPPPTMDFDTPRLLAFQEKFGLDHKPAFQSLARYLANRPAGMESLIARKGDVNFLDPVDLFCQGDECPAFENGHGLYYDSHHLSSHGVKKLTPLYEPIFKREPR